MTGLKGIAGVAAYRCFHGWMPAATHHQHAPIEKNYHPERSPSCNSRLSVVDDTIRLDRTIFARLTTLGTLNSAWFKASATGAGAAVQFATLTTKPKLTAADFVVVA